MNQQTIDLINQYIESNPSATFFELLDTVLDNGYKLSPTWEIINDDAMYNQIVEDLVENHGYAEAEAKESAEDFRPALTDAMWDEYSHVLSELAAGY